MKKKREAPLVISRQSMWPDINLKSFSLKRMSLNQTVMKMILEVSLPSTSMTRARYKKKKNWRANMVEVARQRWLPNVSSKTWTRQLLRSLITWLARSRLVQSMLISLMRGAGQVDRRQRWDTTTILGRMMRKIHDHQSS